MSTAAAPTWHDPAAVRCWREGCGHVLDAHDPDGSCVLMYCECRAWVEPEVEPRRLPSGALPTDGDASTVVRHEFAARSGDRCRWIGPDNLPARQRQHCLRPENHPVHEVSS